MTARKTGDKPGAVFNLDTLEREGTTEPFSFVAKGKRFVIDGLEDKDWQDLVSAGADPIANLRVALGDEQYAEFEKIRGIPAWKLGQLAEAIQQHFGVGDSGEDAGSSGS